MWPSPSVESSGPLAGVRVLDLSRILAGPFATMVLADLGADVVKVERPGTGDETRRWGPPFTTDPAGETVAAYFLACNRNKRSVAADLSSTAGRRLVQGLATEADVAVVNFRPASTLRLGLDPDTLQRLNPRLIVASITGFGADNPYADLPGYDLIVQAMGGFLSITGPEGGPGVKTGVAIGDLGAGLYAVAGILAALHRRAATGSGGTVEISLLDAQVSLLANQAMNFLVGGSNPGPMGNAHPNIVPYETFSTADGEIALGVGSDDQFHRLCELLGEEGLPDDTRFTGNAARVAHRGELRHILESHFRTAPAGEWVTRLRRAGLPCGPVNSVSEVFADPVIAARMLDRIDGIPQVLSPIRLDGERLPLRSPPPPLGAAGDAG
ncbi:MAG: CoA transferase [Actinobacteria bacterium]|nr:MAG: CoA transferase [Actinomycetota bacterium]